MNGSISIIGAGGYVGTQLVEGLVLAGRVGLHAVIRRPKSMARLARFGSAVSVSLADAESSDQLVQTLKGSRVVVNLCTGTPRSIKRTTEAIVSACSALGIPRLIHMSSAVVYGAVETPVQAEDALPLKKHWMPYARAKAWAENWLRDQAARSPIELVVLRPGLVWGVHSPHTLEILRSLNERRAYVVGDGSGIFNGVNIDNFIAVIIAAIDAQSKLSGYFNVADPDPTRWRDFLSCFAAALDFDPARLARAPDDRLPWTSRIILDDVQNNPMLSRLCDVLKSTLSDDVKSAIKKRLATPGDAALPSDEYVEKPAFEREMWHLQKTVNRLPASRIAEFCDSDCFVTLEEAVRRTLTWYGTLNESRIPYPNCVTL